MLNEPHDPTSCTPIPAAKLYDAAKAVRALFVTNGLPSNFPMGFGAPASYFSGVANDGTVNFSNTQYTSKKGTISSWVSDQVAEAKSTGQYLYMTVNAAKDTSNLANNLTYICSNADKTWVKMVGYWTWNRTGGNQTVPLSALGSVRDACKNR